MTSKSLRAYASNFITWCQKWEPEKILDPPLETFNALEHASLPTKVGKLIKFSYIEHSQTTWQIDSNHRLWIGPLQRTFTSVSNSSNGDANLFSKDRSTKSNRRTKLWISDKRLEIYNTTMWASDGDNLKIDPVIAALEAYTKPRSNRSYMVRNSSPSSTLGPRFNPAVHI